MAEHDGLSFAPVFVIDIDILSVLFSCSYVWHDDFLSVEIAREMRRPWQNQPNEYPRPSTSRFNVTFSRLFKLALR